MRFRSRNDLTTPKHFIDILVEHLGPIDMDPCSNPWSVVEAAITYDIHDGMDGLSFDWYKSPSDRDYGFSYEPVRHVFVNPPWGRGHLRKWVQKCGEEARKGCRISLLVPLCPTARWCHELYALGPYIFALKERLVYGGETVTNSRADQLCLLGPWPTDKIQSLARSECFWYLGHPSGDGIFHATEARG